MRMCMCTSEREKRDDPRQRMHYCSAPIPISCSNTWSAFRSPDPSTLGPCAVDATSIVPCMLPAVVMGWDLWTIVKTGAMKDLPGRNYWKKVLWNTWASKHSLRIHGGIFFFFPFKESFPGSKAITEESKIKTEKEAASEVLDSAKTETNPRCDLFSLVRLNLCQLSWILLLAIKSSIWVYLFTALAGSERTICLNQASHCVPSTSCRSFHFLCQGYARWL